MKRMWVNAPSSQQPHHELHGTNVLAILEDDRYSRVYFLSGPVESQQVFTLALSAGWLNNFQEQSK